LCATQNNTEVSFSGVIPNIPICNDTSKKVLHLMGLESFESGITNRATLIDRKGGSRRRGNRHPLPQMLFENQSVWLIRRDHGNVDAINLSRSLARVRQVNRDAEMLRGIRDIKMDSLYPNPSSLVDFETPSGLIQAAYQPEDAKNGSYGRYSGDPIEAICRSKLFAAIAFLFGVAAFFGGSFLMSDGNWARESNLDLRWKTGWLLTAVGSAATLLSVACLLAHYIFPRSNP
jgi:hypothetical protein